MSISFAITVVNEEEEFSRLTEMLKPSLEKYDSEIIVLQDELRPSPEASRVKEHAQKLQNTGIISFFSFPMNNNFSQFKNFLNSKCSKKFIFQIDADEYPDQYLLDNLLLILENNEEIDAYWLSRINTVDGIQESDLQRWGWKMNENGWINFPDPQCRIYRNVSEIEWVYPVHEQLVGFKKSARLPSSKEFCLYHPKTISRQISQNDHYAEIRRTK